MDNLTPYIFLLIVLLLFNSRISMDKQLQGFGYLAIGIVALMLLPQYAGLVK